VTTKRARIGVLTYRRPQDIAAALPELAREALRATAAGWETDIIVVDNDADASAHDTVCEFAAGSPVSIIYRCESTAGIAAARNRVLEESPEVDLLAFIDDDERPIEGWLVLLLKAQLQFGGSVVGPVISKFDVEPSPWITAGRFFVRRRVPTGTLVPAAATNNLLLDLAPINAAGLRFDVGFGLSGGSDTLFTRKLTKLGERIHWCDEAIVYDIVPRDRATRRWVMRRAFRSGTSWSATSPFIAESLSERLRLQVGDFSNGLLRLIGGAARIVLGTILRRQDLRARGARTLARGAGLTAGVFGVRYFEYARGKKA